MDYQGLKTLIPKRTLQWSTLDVCKWLKFISLEKYAPMFEKLSIDGSCLRLINQRDLIEEIGVYSKIVCKKFLNWIIFGLQQFDNTFSIGYNDSVEQLLPVAGNTQQTQQTQYPLESDPVQMKQSVKKKQYSQILVLKRVQGKQHIFYKFKQRDCRIGRDQNCEIQISGDNIDPFHVHISHRNGSYYLRNLSAQSSTFIKVQTRTIISDGMVVEMGSNVFRFQLQEDLRLSLRIFEGKNIGQIYKYSKNKSKITLGRKPGNDLCFNKDNTLSNLHAKITYSDLCWYLEDLATTNGTWVQINQQQRISTGVVFKLGQSNYQFECELRKSREDHQIQEHVVILLKQNQKCLRCKENIRDILFVPCNHCAVCEECSAQETYCVICHCKIASKSKLFRS